MSAASIAAALAKLAPPVLEFVSEVIGAVANTKTKRDAARAASVVVAKRLVWR